MRFPCCKKKADRLAIAGAFSPLIGEAPE